MFLLIKQCLLSDPAVSAMVREEVYPDFVPEKKVLPAISMFQVSGQLKDLVDGLALPTESRWQLNCVATTRKESSELASLVEKALHGKAEGPIKRITVTNRQDDLPAAGVRIRSTLLDVTIKHA